MGEVATLIADLIRANVDPDLVARVAEALVVAAAEKPAESGIKAANAATKNCPGERQFSASATPSCLRPKSAAERAMAYRERKRQAQARDDRHEERHDRHATAVTPNVTDFVTGDVMRDASPRARAFLFSEDVKVLAPDHPSDDCPPYTECVTNAVTLRDEKRDGETSPRVRRDASKRGCRIPDGITLSDTGRQYALNKGQTESEANEEFEAFVDYWRAKAGKAALKADWEAAWRSWVRNANKFSSDRSSDAQRERAPNPWLQAVRNIEAKRRDGRDR